MSGLAWFCAGFLSAFAVSTLAGLAMAAVMHNTDD